jgi:hypothetical protein
VRVVRPEQTTARFRWWARWTATLSLLCRRSSRRVCLGLTSELTVKYRPVVTFSPLPGDAQLSCETNMHNFDMGAPYVYSKPTNCAHAHTHIRTYAHTSTHAHLRARANRLFENATFLSVLVCRLPRCIGSCAHQSTVCTVSFATLL